MDGADQLLLSERSHLLSLKKILESHLSKVQMQLQELSKARARLTAVIQERSRVTDLLCQSMMTGASSNLPTPRTRTLRPNSASRSRLSSPHSRAKLSSSRSSVNLASRHSKSFSAPVPISFARDLTTVTEIASGGSDMVGEGEEGGSVARQQTPPKSARSRVDGESSQIGTQVHVGAHSRHKGWCHKCDCRQLFQPNWASSVQ